jgi:uncharacterized protein YkwD
VTRPGTLIAAASSIVVLAIGGSADAAVAHNAPVAHAASLHGAAARSSAHARTAASHGRRASGGCTAPWPSSHAKHRASCRTPASRHRTTRLSTRHALRPPRPGSPGVRTTSSREEAAARQAATIAKVLATPCQNTQLTPEAGNLALVRAAVLCLVNTERAQNGEGPLSADPRLEQAAESHGKEMLSLNYFDHIAPSGLTPVGRIRTTGYIPNSEVGYVIGENLAWGTLTLATPQSIVNAWIASPEHLANILEGKYHDTGIDVEPEVPQELAEGVAGALYTQEFAVIVH